FLAGRTNGRNSALRKHRHSKAASFARHALAGVRLQLCRVPFHTGPCPPPAGYDWALPGFNARRRLEDGAVGGGAAERAVPDHGMDILPARLAGGTHGEQTTPTRDHCLAHPGVSAARAIAEFVDSFTPFSQTRTKATVYG